MQIIIEDRDNSNNVISRIPVDFIMELSENTGTAPYFISPTPSPSDTTLNVVAGQNISFDINAVDNDINDQVTLEAVSLPIGSTMTPSLPVTGAPNSNATSTFSWTPTSGQAGNTYTITFVAEDNSTNQVFHTININVLTCQAAPTIVTSCPANITVCGAQNITWTPPTATDNCQVTTTSNMSPGDMFGVGTTTVTYTFTNTANGSVQCSFDVTVYPNPSVSIVTSTLPDFCQGFAKLSASVSNAGSLQAPLSYSWTGQQTSSDNAITALSNGTYYLTVTDAHGCSSTTSTTLNMDPSTVLSGYNLLANTEVHLHKSTVTNGGVGVRNANKKAKIHDHSTVQTFVKAPTIQVNGGSSVGTQISGQANVTLPAFVTNTFNNNNTTTVNQNQTTSLTGSNYGKIKIKKNAVVTFTQSTVYIRSLETEENVTINFSGDAILVVKNKVELEDNNTFNSAGKRVIMYVGDEFEIEGGSSFTANVFACEEIEAKGHRDGSWRWDDDNCGGGTSNAAHTTMTGMFISKEKIKSGKNVDWYRGTACSVSSGFSAREAMAWNEDGNQFTEAGDLDNSITISPNPADRQASISLNGFDHEAVTISIFDNLGRRVYSQVVEANSANIVVDLSANTFTNGMFTVQATSASHQASRRLYIVR